MSVPRLFFITILVTLFGGAGRAAGGACIGYAIPEAIESFKPRRHRPAPVHQPGSLDADDHGTGGAEEEVAPVEADSRMAAFLAGFGIMFGAGAGLVVALIDRAVRGGRARLEACREG